MIPYWQPAAFAGNLCVLYGTPHDSKQRMSEKINEHFEMSWQFKASYLKYTL
jgi:hypothetical protein